MKTIAFITRVHPERQNMLKQCIESIKAQVSDDYVHILHRHDRTKNGYGLLSANQSLAKVAPIDAQYVMILDDDDVLIDPDFVEVFAKAVKENSPEIVFFKGNVHMFGILPRPNLWGKAPVYTGIASFCYAVRLDIWTRYIHEFGGRGHGGDFRFISHCYAGTKKHLWIDRIIAKTQKKPGVGLGEREHA